MEQTLTIVAPLFGLILGGNLVARLPVFPRSGVAWLVRYVWYLAMPVAVFSATLGNPLPDASAVRTLATYFIPLGLCFLLAVKLGRYRFEQVANVRAVYGYSACFGNIIYMGLPIILALFGQSGMATLVLIISVHELILISLTMTVRQGEAGHLASVLGSALGETLKVPLVLAIIAGFVGAMLDLQLGGLVADAANLIAPTAAPVGLFAVGAALAGVKIAGDIPQAATASVIKMLLLPAFVTLSCWATGLDSRTSAILILVASLPTGLNAFNMAQKYHAAPRRVATTILLGTLVAVPVLPALIWLMGDV